MAKFDEMFAKWQFLAQTGRFPTATELPDVTQHVLSWFQIDPVAMMLEWTESYKSFLPSEEPEFYYIDEFHDNMDSKM